MKSKEELNQASSYVDLEKLFLDWRNFENPPLLNGAPDYTKSQFKKPQNTFYSLKNRLMSIDTSKWSVHQKVNGRIC